VFHAAAPWPSLAKDIARAVSRRDCERCLGQIFVEHGGLLSAVMTRG
jgi:hypothetical protein